MSKSKLRDGMVVEIRSGDRYLVWRGGLNRNEGWVSLRDYNENLMCIANTGPETLPLDEKINKEFDIMKIGHHLGVNIFDLSDDNPFNINWFWKRDTCKLTKDEYEFILKLKEVYGCKEFEIYIDELGYLNVIGYGENGFGFIEIPLTYYNQEYEVRIRFEDLIKDKTYHINDILSNYEIKEI